MLLFIFLLNNTSSANPFTAIVSTIPAFSENTIQDQIIKCLRSFYLYMTFNAFCFTTFDNDMKISVTIKAYNL